MKITEVGKKKENRDTMDLASSKRIILFLFMVFLFESGAQGKESSFENMENFRIRVEKLQGKTFEPLPLEPLIHQEPQINPFRLGILGSATAGTGLVLKNYYERIWWEGKPQRFHFNDDLTALRLTDKFGHTYVAILITEFYTPLIRWSGFSTENSRWGGVSASLLHQLVFVEFQDSFSEWGFSLSDAASDVVGAFYPLLQDHSPFLDKFNFKWSYHPSLHSWKDYFHLDTIIKDLYDNAFHMDYNGMTFWLSGDIHSFLPHSLKNYWPNFLNLALGYSVEEMDIHKRGSGYSEIFLALDYDMRKLPGGGRVWNGMKNVLNYIHFPAPAVRITPDAVFYVLYF